MKVLAGDIGGTKTLLHIAEVRGNHIKVLHQARYASQDYPDFETLLREFLAQAPATLRNTVTGACFGVAGPIGGEAGARHAKVTNLPWHLDEATLQSLLQLPRARLINDFFAVANGIEALDTEELYLLNAGKPQPRLPRLVIGAGTGLGVAQLMWCDNRYRAFPSEGGHGHFAPTNALQAELLFYLQRRHGRVSHERVVSGTGLVALFEFLAQRENAAADMQTIMSSPDPAAAISARARSGDAMAQEAVSLFLSIYGAVVGDLALVTLARGGVYVAGGIAAKLLDEMRAGTFLEAYGRKGRMSGLVMEMPVAIVLAQDVGLRGASMAATQL